ncbi:hypothetical protein HZA73_03845 [candidate division TA06 bacterium]|nr:hypothetical protein [candidate division TA06 bacterium]
MKRLILIIMAIAIVACPVTSAFAGNWIVAGIVWDNGVVVSGASVHCEHSDGGWCGDTYWPNTTTTSDGRFDIDAHYPEDQAGYYSLCVTYGNKWAHVLNFYSTCVYTGAVFDNIVLQSGAHPSHNMCQ